MSHFISFEPLIIPVYAPCLCLYAVLLSTRHSNHDPLLTLTRSRMTTGGAGGGPQGPSQHPGRRLDSSLTEFACALRGAKLDPIKVEGGGPAMKLTFEPSLTFPDDLKRRHKGLMIRDFYYRLFERVASMERSLLTGVPGIGKSWWIWYAMNLIFNKEPAPCVVWQTFKRGGDECVLFKGAAFSTLFSERSVNCLFKFVPSRHILRRQGLRGPTQCLP